MKAHVVTQEEFEEMDEENGGWCTGCLEWTGEFCEPDAREYQCPECNEHTVYGAAQALIEGHITF